MKKKLSVKELALFAILFVLLIFLYISRGPLQSRIDNLTEEGYALEDQIAEIEPTIEQMDIWQAELDSVYQKYSGNPKSIPYFNNINNVIAEMSTIFDGDSTYTITFADPTINEHIAERYIRISFSCGKYEEMINKLIAINNSDNRYRIEDLSINQDSADSYTASFGIAAYEYVTE